MVYDALHLFYTTITPGSIGGTESVFERLHSQPDEPPPEGQIVAMSDPKSNDTITCVRLGTDLFGDISQI